MGDGHMNRRDAPSGDQSSSLLVQSDDRFSAGFMRNADQPPRDCMTEGFACRLLCGKEPGQPFRPVSFAHRVPILFIGIHLAPKPSESGIVEAIPLDFGEVHPESDDHKNALRRPNKFSVPDGEEALSKMESVVRIIPINAIDPAFLARLALCLEERFLYSIRVERALVIPRSAVNSTRQQMFLSTLTSKVVRSASTDSGLLLAITDFDLYKTSHRFLFGDADEQQRVAVVSLHRLRSEFYGEDPDENQLFQRTLKECVHELGHAVGLKHCYNARCAMYFSNSIFETDNKMSHFCETCDKRSRARS